MELQERDLGNWVSVPGDTRRSPRGWIGRTKELKLDVLLTLSNWWYTYPPWKIRLCQIGSSSHILGKIFKNVPNHLAVVDIFNVDHCGTCWKLPTLSWSRATLEIRTTRHQFVMGILRQLADQLQDHWSGWMETSHRKLWRSHQPGTGFSCQCSWWCTISQLEIMGYYWDICTGWWCNNNLEKWWSSSMGRMTSHI